MQSLLINPSRRGRSKKRRASSRRRRRGTRGMSALQLKYFGKGRKRRASSGRRSRRRSRVITIHANPSRRSRRRSRRSYRRNPASRAFRMPALGLNASGIMANASRGIQGAGGAIVTDIAMAQAAAFIPTSLSSRYTEEGNVNPAYYATKLLLATVLGSLAARFLPGRAKAWAGAGVAGAFTVAAYEVGRVILPPAITLGAYLNPATVVSGGMGRMGRLRGRGGMGRLMGRGGMGAYLTRSNVAGMRASFGAGSAHPIGSRDVRVGEGNIQ